MTSERRAIRVLNGTSSEHKKPPTRHPNLRLRENYTVGEIVRILEVGPRTVTGWIDSGRLPGYRLPGSLDRRVTRRSLEHFVKEYGLPTAPFDRVNRLHVLLVVAAGPDRDQVLVALPEADVRAQTCDEWFAAGRCSAAQSWDVVVLDCALGRGAALHVRGLLAQTHPDALVVVLANEDETDHAPLAAAADVVICRPFDPAALARIVYPAAVRGQAPEAR